MKIRWHGHACFEIKNDITIITDPHDGKSIGIPIPNVKADIVLSSHDHFDHNCIRVVKGEPKAITRVCNIVEKGVEIKGIKAYHDENKGERRGEVIIFKFSMHSIIFCHLGDLGHVLEDETVEKIGKVDFLFIPIGGVFTIDYFKAWEVIDKIKPKVVVPMHYRVGGLSLNINTPEKFIEKAEKDKILEKVGNEIEFERDDLPEKMEVWMFSL